MVVPVVLRNLGKPGGPIYHVDRDFALLLQRIEKAADRALEVRRSYPRLPGAVTYRH